MHDINIFRMRKYPLKHKHSIIFFPSPDMWCIRHFETNPLSSSYSVLYEYFLLLLLLEIFNIVRFTLEIHRMRERKTENEIPKNCIKYSVLALFIVFFFFPLYAMKIFVHHRQKIQKKILWIYVISEQFFIIRKTSKEQLQFS